MEQQQIPEAFQNEINKQAKAIVWGDGKDLRYCESQHDRLIRMYELGAKSGYRHLSPEIEALRGALVLAEVEIKAFYRRFGIQRSNISEMIAKILDQYPSPSPKDKDNG